VMTARARHSSSGLGTSALAIGMVLEILESPRVRGFVVAAGCHRVFFHCDMALFEPCQVWFTLESLVEGYPVPTWGWRSSTQMQFW
jgi:hypothetical protein